MKAVKKFPEVISVSFSSTSDQLNDVHLQEFDVGLLRYEMGVLTPTLMSNHILISGSQLGVSNGSDIFYDASTEHMIINGGVSSKRIHLVLGVRRRFDNFFVDYLNNAVLLLRRYT